MGVARSENFILLKELFLECDISVTVYNQVDTILF